MNTLKQGKRQLQKVQNSIDQLEASARSGPVIDCHGHAAVITHLHAHRDAIRRELGIAPTAAERRNP